MAVLLIALDEQQQHLHDKLFSSLALSFLDHNKINRTEEKRKKRKIFSSSLFMDRTIDSLDSFFSMRSKARTKSFYDGQNFYVSKALVLFQG